MALLQRSGLGDRELPVEPGRLAAIDRRRLEQRPRAAILVAELHALDPVRAVRRGRHPPQRHALVVDGVVALLLGSDHAGGERGVPEDLLSDVALRERRQRLIEVVVGGSGRGVLAQPFVPLADRIHRSRPVRFATSGHGGARRIARTLLHADAPLVDRAAVGQALGARARHREPGVGHAPTQIRRTLAVVHVAVHAHAIDVLHVHGEELGDVFVGGPVERDAQLVAVALLERLLQLRSLEPVVPEPIEVRELLVGQLPQLAVRPGGERLADEVVDVQRRQRDVFSFAGHPVGEVDG